MSGKNVISREALSKAASLVRPALSNQSFIQSLTHIKFSDGWMTTYNDITSISVKGPVPEEMSFCLPGDLLVKALSGFSAADIAVQDNVKEGSVLVSAGRSKLKLPSLPVRDFPFELPDVDADAEIVLSASMLTGIAQCLFSVGTDPTHAAQMGVTLDSTSSGCALLFSTDNFTISRYETDTRFKLPAGTPVILPTFFCEQITTLSKALPNAAVRLKLYPGAVVATFGDEAVLFTKMVDDIEPIDFDTMVRQYFDPDKINDVSFDVPPGLESALQRTLLVLQNDADKVVKVSLGDDTFKIQCSSSLGDTSDTFTADHESDAEFFHTDPALVLRALKQSTCLAFLPKVLVLCNSTGSFIHMISHCSA